MAFFDQIYARLFPKGKKEAEPVVIDQVLKRSDSYLDRYRKWRGSEEAEELVHDVLQSYQSALDGVERIPALLLHRSTNSNGFAIAYDREYDQSTFPFLLEFLADKIKDLGYRAVMNRQTLKERGNDVEKKEMYYLKPKPGFVEPIDQKFGNVQIEFVAFNEQPARIKLIANTYSDRKYTTPGSFDTLISKILN